VPAKAIVALFGQQKEDLAGNYFILNNKVKSSVASLNELQDEVWTQICGDFDLNSEFRI
jgi:hypothetical protein